VIHRVLLLHLLLVIGFLLIGTPRLHAQTPPPTLDEYEDLVREAYAAASRSDRIGLDDVAARLDAVREVAIADDTTIPADNRWLTESLAQEPPQYRLITARLGALLDALGQGQTPPAADAQQKLDAVFSRPPFQSREVPSAWTQFWRGVGNAIDNFFDWLFRSLPSGSGVNAPSTPTSFGTLTPLGWALLLLGGLLVVGLVVYAVRGARQSVVRDAKVRAEAELDEENITATEALNRAQGQARDGDYRNAVRYLYLGSLLWLDERKLLRYDRSLTNREYLQQAAANGELRERLGPVVGTFERVWYGHRDLQEDDFRAYEQQVEQLRDLEQPR
jgi:hypothetical protein